MHFLRHLLLRHPLALVSFLVSTCIVGTPYQVKAAQIIPQNQMNASTDSVQNGNYAASKSIDGDTTTMWHTQWSPKSSRLPHHITFQLSAPYIVSGLRYLPRQDGKLFGIITQYAVHVSLDGTSWGTPVAQGTWAGTSALQEVTFTGIQARYVRLVAIASAGGYAYASAAEINLFGTPPFVPPTPSTLSRKLTWADNAQNEDGYKIERKVDLTGSYVRLAVTPANTTSYIDADTQSGTVYCYRVQAFNTLGSSSFSNEACSTGSGTTAPIQPPDIGSDGGTIAITDSPQKPSAPHEGNSDTHSARSLTVHVGVFRPSTASWYLDRNGNGLFDGCSVDVCSSSFGLTEDLPVVGDWKGSGVSHIGVFNPNSRLWDLDANNNARWDACEDDLCRGPFGKTNDLPVTGSWQGKGNPTRIGVYRPSTGEWILDTNGNGRVDRSGDNDTRLGPFGTSTDLPVVGDWTGVGKTHIGTFDPNTRQWRLDQNGNGVFDGCSVDRCAGPFGTAESFPIVADWLGSGTSQIGTFDSATGMWQLDTNGNGVFDGCTVDHCIGPFGQAGDIPLVGQW